MRYYFQPVATTNFGFSRQSQPRQMGVNRLLLQQVQAPFGVDFRRDATWDFSPVIKYLRDVTDANPGFTEPQHELKILDAIESLIKPNSPSETAANSQQMPDVHHAAQILRRPIRLMKSFRELPGQFIVLVLVGIDDVEALREAFRHKS